MGKRIVERFRDISIRINSKIRMLLLHHGYYPRLFWEIWGRVFAYEEYQTKILLQHPWLLSRLQQARPHSILEVGCGFGRNIKFLLENHDFDNIVGVDFSRSMLARARRVYGISSSRLTCADANNLPFADNSFDCVFTMGLLMHVPTDRVEKALDEIVRTSRKDIIIMEQWYAAGGKINRFTFQHDYRAMFDKKNLDILHRQIVKNNEQLLCIHAEKRLNI